MSKPKAAPNTGTEAVSQIVKSAKEIQFPLRSLSNVSYTYVMDTYLPAKLRQPEKFLP